MVARLARRFYQSKNVVKRNDQVLCINKMHAYSEITFELSPMHTSWAFVPIIFHFVNHWSWSLRKFDFIMDSRLKSTANCITVVIVNCTCFCLLIWMLSIFIFVRTLLCFFIFRRTSAFGCSHQSPASLLFYLTMARFIWWRFVIKSQIQPYGCSFNIIAFAFAVSYPLRICGWIFLLSVHVHGYRWWR